MKRIILFIASIFFSMHLFAQTGIGTTTPDASAKLDVSATNKGFLPPRVTLTSISDNSTIPSPATGLLIYNTGNNVGLAAGYYYWNGNAWATIATAGGSGSFAASFLRGSRTATESVAKDGIVIFSNVDNTAGQDISLNTSTGKITLAPGNTYRLIAAVPTFTSGQRPSFMWYNETTSSYIGSASSTYNTGDAASYGAFGVIAHLIITPSVSTVISFKMLSSLSNGSVTIGGNGDFSTTGSYPWFEAQVISGNAPVTGQSVDYVQASLSANQSLTSAGNINFNVSSGAGISLTSGGFNLLANKTYKLEAALGGTSGGYAYYGWVDNANNLLPGGSIGTVMKAGSAFTDAPQDKAVVYFTPTVNTTVYLRVYSLSGTLTAYAPSISSNYSSSWANITQIGSSAIVNSWTLSGTNTYNTSGNVGIGTSSPSESALLDLTSSSKGLLLPRVALTTKSGTTTIASPTTGLIVYNTASAGTGGDAVTPGYYFFNGTIWTRIDPDGWSTPVTITFGAPSGSTSPTKGASPTYDYVRYRNLGGKEYEVEYNFVQVNTGTAGNSDYLITLPGGLRFDFTAPGQTAYTGATGINAISARLVSAFGDLFHVSAHNSATAVPYDATRFRIHTNSWGTVGWTFYNYTYYQLSVEKSGFKMTFKFKAT
jgi:hypothetical protein